MSAGSSTTILYLPQCLSASLFMALIHSRFFSFNQLTYIEEGIFAKNPTLGALYVRNDDFSVSSFVFLLFFILFFANPMKISHH